MTPDVEGLRKPIKLLQEVTSDIFMHYVHLCLLLAFTVQLEIKDR